MTNLELILPASMIPGGETVRKVTGAVRYTIHLMHMTLPVELPIYPSEDQWKFPEDSVYLVQAEDPRSINRYHGSKTLVWIVSPKMLSRYLALNYPGEV